MRVYEWKQGLGYALLLLLISFVIQVPAAAQPLTAKQFGVHLRNDNRPLPSHWDSLVQQSGSGLVRIPVVWGWFELEGKGKTPTWFWPQLDEYVNRAKHAGQKVLISFASTPCWATVNYAGKSCSAAVLAAGSWRFNMPPANAADYTDALKRIATRYHANPATRNVVIAYEIWNEPNIVNFWAQMKRRTIPFEYNNGYPFQVDRASIKAYTQLVKGSYSSLKALNPDLKVIAGSIAGTDTYFLEEMYKAGAKGNFDALSLHPYPSTIQAERHPYYGRAAPANDCIKFSALPHEGCLKQGVEAMRAMMLKYGDNKPVWFTEFGVSSSPDWGGAGQIKSLNAAEQAQATEAFKLIHLIKSWDFVEAALWYELINRPKQADYASNIWVQPEPYFGFYREDSSAKPVLTAYQAQVKAQPLPVQLYPAGDISQQEYPAEFSWQAVPNAIGYVLWLNYKATPAQNGKINRYVTAAQAQCATGYTCKLKDSTAFANNISSDWWVKAFFADGSSRDSRAVSFKLIAPPAPSLISPKHNTTVTTSAAINVPRFVWKPFPNAVSYRLWVRGYTPYGVDQADQNGEEQIIQHSLTPSQATCNAASCQYKPNLSLGYAPAQWTVTAMLSNGKQLTSPPQGFTLYPSKSVFMKPAQIEPEGKITTQKPTYAWTPVGAATAYRLWVNAGNGAGVVHLSVPSSVCNSGECRYTPTIAVGNGDAVWWVTALQGGQEAMSDGMAFRVQ